MNIKIPLEIKKLMADIIIEGFEAYIVGGAVRDSIMGIEPHDWDIFTNCTDILRIFPRGKVLGGEERQTKILTVIVDGVEISTYRGNGDRTQYGKTIEEHQSTCDFTINSIACDIGGKLTDTQGGIFDIQYKILRFVGNPEDRIKEDKLRVLRGIRFALKYDLIYDTKTYIPIYKTDISDLPCERIKDELVKILKLNFQNITVKSIQNFIPKQLTGKNMHSDGGKWHKETPYKHSCNSFMISCKESSDYRIRIAALLHDVGKDITKTTDGEETHFYEHHKVGADIVRDWMNNLKFSKADTDFVYWLIYNHMHGYNGKEISKKSYINLFKGMEDNNVDILDFVTIMYCDNQGNEAKPRMSFLEFLKESVYLKNYYKLKHSDEPFKVSELKISGSDIIEKCNVKQGKVVGDILKNVFDKVIDGDLKNKRSDLLFYIKNMDFILLKSYKRK